jgi:hypothetical protein
MSIPIFRYVRVAETEKTLGMVSQVSTIRAVTLLEKTAHMPITVVFVSVINWRIKEGEMKTVEFNLAVWKAHVAGKPIGQSFVDGTYLCSELKDCSGTYVLAQEVDERIKALEDALKKITALNPEDTYDGCNEWGEAECFTKAQKIATKALEVKL